MTVPALLFCCLYASGMLGTIAPKGWHPPEASQAEHGGQQIGVAGQCVECLPAREQGRIVHDEWHMGGLLVCLMPLLVHAAMGAEQIPMVGSEDHDGVRGHVGVGVERVEDPLDLLVHVPL